MHHHPFTPKPQTPRSCLRCPFADGHPIHDTAGNAVTSQGTMVLAVAPSGAATLILPDGTRMAGTLYPR